jgi:AT-rich interactive domain-containing protein 1
MVILANISGAVDLELFEEDISRPILDGLLEWAVSSSAYAQDPFPNVGPGSPVSPQRCAIEALCKFCLLETNIDLMLSTPPFSRLEKLIKILAKKLYRFEDQVLREFSINMLFYLSAADTGISRIIALSETTISLLLSFIEQAEQNAMVIAQQHGVNALRDNPDCMGTSLDMLRRAANTLAHLSQHPDNIPLLVRQEQRLLSLVMSQILDQGVASILSQVLFNIGANAAPPPVPPTLPATPPPPPADPLPVDPLPASEEGAEASPAPKEESGKS